MTKTKVVQKTTRQIKTPRTIRKESPSVIFKNFSDFFMQKD